jgi:hypothetical protein
MSDIEIFVNYTSGMIRPRVWTALILSLLSTSYAHSGHIRVLDRTVIQQQNSPVAFVKWRGSSVVIKNATDKPIASFVFVCVVRKGRTYRAVGKYDSAEGPVGAGEFSNEGGMDATPLNACRSWKGLLAVGSVKFFDGSYWESALLKSMPPTSQ